MTILRRPPTLAPTENVDDEEPAPTEAPEDTSTPIPTETFQNEESASTEAPECVSTSVPMDTVDDGQPDLTRAA